MQATSRSVSAPTTNSPSLLFGLIAVVILASVWGWILGFGKTFSTKPTVAASFPTVEATPSYEPPALSTPVVISNASNPSTTIVRTETPPKIEPVAALTASTLQLKMATSITSVRFPTGGVLLDPVAAAQVASFAAEPNTKSAAKIHLTGYSGNSKFTLRERRQLAFERAFSVKVALTNSHGYDPQKIRMFYLSNDHFGQPRVDFQTFQTIAEASASLSK